MNYIVLVLLSLPLLFADLARADPATFTWDQHPGPIAGFKLYESTTPGVYGAPLATITPGTATNFIIDIPQRAEATTHFFIMTAYKDSGLESLYSNEVSKIIPAIVVIPKPGTPVLTVSTIGETSVEVSWPAVDDGTGKNALVNVRLSLASVTNWGSMVSAVCPSSPCTIPGLNPGAQYRVQAVAVRADPGKNVFGPLSEVASFTTVGTPPVAPTGLKVTKATPTEVIITASALDCPTVRTSTRGSSSLVQVRTVSCTQ